jgi:hypothetical protein
MEHRPSRRFWITWVLATLYGSLLGVVIAWLVEDSLKSVVIGLVTGIMQYLFLRPYFPGALWWIPATSIGVALSSIVRPSIAFYTTLALAGAVGGFIIGLSQWLVLRRRISGVGWWLGVTTFSSGLSWAMSESIMATVFVGIGHAFLGRLLLGPVITTTLGLVSAISTGILLTWKLRQLQQPL